MAVFVLCFRVVSRLLCLLQRGLVPLERFLRLERGRAVHDEHPAWPKLDTQRRHDEVSHHVQPLVLVDLHTGGEAA